MDTLISDASSCYFCGKQAESTKSILKGYYLLSSGSVWTERVGNNLVYHSNHSNETVVIPRCAECAGHHTIEQRVINPIIMVCGFGGIVGGIITLINAGFWKGLGVFALCFMVGVGIYLAGGAILYKGLKNSKNLEYDKFKTFPRVKSLLESGWKEGKAPSKGDMDDVIRKRRGH